MSRLPSDDERLRSESFWLDNEHPELYVYDPERVNAWFWEQPYEVTKTLIM